jgi:hypothetical protein
VRGREHVAHGLGLGLGVHHHDGIGAREAGILRRWRVERLGARREALRPLNVQALEVGVGKTR